MFRILKNRSFIFLLLCVFSLLSCQKVNWITIGVLEDQSGSFRSISQNLSNGRSLALSEMSNQQGFGWKIRIKSNDTMNLPEKTANLMRDINKQVDLFLGVSSVECAQVAKYVAHYRKKILLSEAIDDSITDHVSSTLLIQQTPINTGKLSVRYFFSNLKKDRMLVLYDESNNSYKGIAKGFIEEGKLIGSQVFEESFNASLGKVDFNRVLTRVKSLNPQVIFICAYEKDSIELLKLILQTFEIPALLFLNRVPDDISLNSNPDLYKQIFCITPFYDKKDSFVSSAFYQKYLQKFNQKPDYYASLGYDEMVLVREMVKKNSNQYQKELFSQLKGSSWDAKSFVTGFLGFSSDGLAKRPIDIMKISNGKISLLETFWTEVSLRR